MGGGGPPGGSGGSNSTSNSNSSSNQGDPGNNSNPSQTGHTTNNYYSNTSGGGKYGNNGNNGNNNSNYPLNYNLDIPLDNNNNTMYSRPGTQRNISGGNNSSMSYTGRAGSMPNKNTGATYTQQTSRQRVKLDNKTRELEREIENLRKSILNIESNTQSFLDAFNNRLETLEVYNFKPLRLVKNTFEDMGKQIIDRFKKEININGLRKFLNREEMEINKAGNYKFFNQDDVDMSQTLGKYTGIIDRIT